MNRHVFIVAPVALVLLFCKGSQETTTSTSSSSTTAASAETSAPASAAPAPAQQAAAIPAQTTVAGTVASEDTNWPGVKAEVTEFRRKGNTLTAKVRFTNSGTEQATVEVNFDEIYLIDTAGGKKYQTL